MALSPVIFKPFIQSLLYYTHTRKLLSSECHMHIKLSWYRQQMEMFSALLVLFMGIHRWPVDSPHKGQWRGALTFSLTWAWTNGWANIRDARDSIRHRAHYDVIATILRCCYLSYICCRSLSVMFIVQDLQIHLNWILYTSKFSSPAWYLPSSIICTTKQLCRHMFKSYMIW